MEGPLNRPHDRRGDYQFNMPGQFLYYLNMNTISNGSDGIAQIRERTPRLSELRQRLLELSGREVLFFGPEPDLDNLLARGRSFPTRRLRRRFIEDHRCHQSTALLWFESEGRIGIVTGYALAGDDIWAPHSWGVEDGTVVETTRVRRQCYFGVALTDSEALRFAVSNLPPEIVARIESDATEGRWPLPIIREFLAGTA